jgi:hypothetical protein
MSHTRTESLGQFFMGKLSTDFALLVILLGTVVLSSEILLQVVILLQAYHAARAADSTTQSRS